LSHARVTATARRIEFDKVAGRKILADHRVLTQRGKRHPLQHVRIARTERLARHQPKGRVVAYLQTQQNVFQRRRKMTGAQQQRGGLSANVLTMSAPSSSASR